MMSNIPVRLKKNLTYKNIFGKEKKVMSKGGYVDLEDVLVRVSFRCNEYIIPIENIEIPKNLLNLIKEVGNNE